MTTKIPIPIDGAGQCTCDNMCPGADIVDCTCIFTVHDSICFCDCDHAPHVLKRDLPLATRVAVDMGSNVTVARLGVFLAKITELELLIPAARADDKLEIKDRDTTLGAVIERAGLIVVDPGPTAD